MENLNGEILQELEDGIDVIVANTCSKFGVENVNKELLLMFILFSAEVAINAFDLSEQRYMILCKNLYRESFANNKTIPPLPIKDLN